MRGTLLLLRRLAWKGARCTSCTGPSKSAFLYSVRCAHLVRSISAEEGQQSTTSGFSYRHYAAVLAALGFGCTSRAYAESGTEESSLPVPQDTVRLCSMCYQCSFHVQFFKTQLCDPGTAEKEVLRLHVV